MEEQLKIDERSINCLIFNKAPTFSHRLI